VPIVLDLVEPNLLQREPPRQLPPLLIPNLLGEYLIEQPPHTYLDPLLIGSLMAAIAMYLLQIGAWLWLILIAIVAIRLLTAAYRLGQRIRDDVALLKHGVVLTALIIKVRNSRDQTGAINGAYLDCVIPIGQRRTSVGSVWLPDAAEAAQLGCEGRIQVFCLTCPPGAWRLLEHRNPALRYEPTRVDV
jgi:hypothetical protein